MTKRMHLYVQKDIYSYKSWKLAFFPNICRAQSSHHLFWTKYKSIIRKDMCLLWKLHNCSYQNSSNITDQSINNTCTCITLRCPVFVKVYLVVLLYKNTSLFSNKNTRTLILYVLLTVLQYWEYPHRVSCSARYHL